MAFLVSNALPRVVGSVAFRRPELPRTLAKLVSRLTCRLGCGEHPDIVEPVKRALAAVCFFERGPLGACDRDFRLSTLQASGGLGLLTTHWSRTVSLLKAVFVFFARGLSMAPPTVGGTNRLRQDRYDG